MKEYLKHVPLYSPIYEIKERLNDGSLKHKYKKIKLLEMTEQVKPPYEKNGNIFERIIKRVFYAQCLHKATGKKTISHETQKPMICINHVICVAFNFFFSLL